MVTDPVCYMEIDPAAAKERVEYRGNTFFFHSIRCREVFEANPSEYAGHIAEKAYGDHGRRTRCAKR